MADIPALLSPSPTGRRRLTAAWTIAWRLWSIRIATLGAAVMTAWSSLPPALRDALPCADPVAAIPFAAVAGGRLIAQDDIVRGIADGEDTDGKHRA